MKKNILAGIMVVALLASLAISPSTFAEETNSDPVQIHTSFQLSSYTDLIITNEDGQTLETDETGRARKYGISGARLVIADGPFPSYDALTLPFGTYSFQYDRAVSSSGDHIYLYGTDQCIKVDGICNGDVVTFICDDINMYTAIEIVGTAAGQEFTVSFRPYYQNPIDITVQATTTDGTMRINLINGSEVTVEGAANYSIRDENAMNFTDVVESDWYYSAVCEVWAQGLMTGMGNDTFSPNTSVSRGMIVTMLYRMEGSPTLNYSYSFGDVVWPSYYYRGVTWAAGNDIATGYSRKSFAPDDAVTREQLAVILYRYIEWKGIDLSVPEGPNVPFADEADISDWAKDAVDALHMSGMISDTDNNHFDPKGSVTRAEAAVIFSRLFSILET